MTTIQTGRNARCHCGSGKKSKHCCGASYGPPDGNRLAQAIALLGQGKIMLAEQIISDLVIAQPRNPTYVYLSGYTALQSGRHKEAASTLDRAIALGLNDAAAFYHFGCALAALGQYLEASVAFKNSLALKPDFLSSSANLANCLFELRQFMAAEQVYRQVIASDPNNIVACHNLGQVFFLTQRVGEAIEYFQRAAEAAPGVAEFRANLATMQEANNDLDAAEMSARTALSIDPRNATAAVALARVLRRRERTAEAFAVLESADIRAGMPRTAIAYWSERGLVLDLLGRYPEAFSDFGKSKALLAETRAEPYDGQTTENALAREREVLTPKRAVFWSRQSVPSTPTPLFIVGFPRSGTTLLEQMLGCHPLIVPCGELETPIELEGSSPDYPESYVNLTDESRQAKLTKLRTDYLTALHVHAERKPQARYASDKFPLNLMRIGLIRLVLPEARIVHVLRHPFDAVLSAYFTPFLFGNTWSFRLADCAHMFAETWKHVESMRKLPGTQFLRVRYEDLLTNTELTLKDVSAFLDIPWNPQCLEFYKSQRIARTASYAQVTRPLYQSSKNRYRHYLDQFDEKTLSVLRPIVSEAGYDVAWT